MKEKVGWFFKSCIFRTKKLLNICLFVTIQCHGSLKSRELGQAPMLLVFLTPRQALSSHPRQQMEWLCWLQDRDSMLNWYTINHPTTLYTQWNPVTHFCSPMALCTAGCIPQAKFDTVMGQNFWNILSSKFMQKLQLFLLFSKFSWELRNVI